MLDRRRFRLRSRHLEHTICVSCQKEVSRSGREGGPNGRHRPPSPSLFCRGYVKRGATNRYRIVFGLGAMQSIKRPSIPSRRPTARPIDRSECRIDGNFPRKLERRALSTAPSPAAISRWSVGQSFFRVAIVAGAALAVVAVGADSGSSEITAHTHPAPSPDFMTDCLTGASRRTTVGRGNRRGTDGRADDAEQNIPHCFSPSPPPCAAPLSRRSTATAAVFLEPLSLRVDC